ncbi:dynein light chain 2, putative [Plasmodium chabaudi chabaudi]|uniref:Dynein light chain 2, putative n=1 Tax=Plasmodium chabaudi chabaudi TaxID=31271 RepID=A0A077XEE0_PLACU|nr:dynein light chain Tctex-type, putative [Plasmodium chabaudi chabaudi]SCN60225.1 dynein light chain 2, putative [Plasmodium chabaudi chabaudi]VTZ68715.1 dynein light chain Tctex-type, putative [Plasmodium chabaudi chabaudi]|eukprot:XP_016655331.1 dynein light chain 2, putative [Plasmodium chabaudi chabaudi]
MMEGIKKSTPQNLDISENEQNSKDENKVDMNGFCFFVNTCEEKLNEFLENYFCNKTDEELKYTEENQGANNCINNYNEKNDNTNAENDDNYISSHNTNSNTANNEDNSDNDSSNENEKNYYEKKTIKSNYDRIAINLVDTVEQFMEPYVNERYKIVVHAIIGENKKQGIHIASKSLWNVETDNYISAKYVNDFIFVTVMVFLLYNE